MRTFIIATAIALFIVPMPTARAEETPETMLLTIFLKHDQTKNLEEIQSNLTKNRFYDTFPPAGTSVVEWNVVMGIGQILVLELPVAKLDEVKKKLIQTTANGFSTDTFVSENLYPQIVERLANRSKLATDAKPSDPGTLMMTVILKPNPGRRKSAAGLVARQKLYENFPPPGSSVISWYEAKGLGEIVSLAFPCALLRTVNLSLEKFGWKAYSTQFYASYDFYPVASETFKLRNKSKKTL